MLKEQVFKSLIIILIPYSRTRSEKGEWGMELIYQLRYKMCLYQVTVHKNLMYDCLLGTKYVHALPLSVNYEAPLEMGLVNSPLASFPYPFILFSCFCHRVKTGGKPDRNLLFVLFIFIKWIKIGLFRKQWTNLFSLPNISWQTHDGWLAQ